jgi:hypothetical protein
MVKQMGRSINLRGDEDDRRYGCLIGGEFWGIVGLIRVASLGLPQTSRHLATLREADRGEGNAPRDPSMAAAAMAAKRRSVETEGIADLYPNPHAVLVGVDLLR